MRKKTDLSNLLSKKVKHNKNNYHHNNNYNRSFSNNKTDNYNSLNEKEQSKNQILQNNNSITDDRNDDITDELTSANIKIKMPIKNIVILVAIIPFIVLIFLLFSVILLFQDNEKIINQRIAFGGMYNGRCSEMTVIFVDSKNGYQPTGTQTYSMTDYVAGVVYAEVGGFKNIEVYKTFAVAARTFGLKHASEDCTIEGSARRQAFKDVTNIDNEYVKLIYEAVEATEGQVLLSNGDLYSIQYDAFCFIDKDSNYYTLSQKNQKIPTEWAESNVWSKAYLNCPCDLKDESMTECWNGKTWEDGGHGRGMSQYGSYYLARELDYTYDQILNYYYGNDEITISSNSFTSGIEGITSIAGLEIKDTTKAKYLQQPITEFLNSKGSSLDNLNAFIHDSVVDQGAGTRAGVVTAAVSMINYLYDNFNIRLPYYWGGSSERIGLPSTFGTYSPSSVSRGGNVNYYKSFDCSGFVSWVIKNGGYNFSRISTTGFDSRFSQNSCDITDANCIGQPGDLINSRNGHVELIIAVDQENGKYFIAHSGGPGVVMMERNMHTKNYGSTVTKILFMEEFYNNPLNVNPNY